MGRRSVATSLVMVLILGVTAVMEVPAAIAAGGDRVILTRTQLGATPVHKGLRTPVQTLHLPTGRWVVLAKAHVSACKKCRVTVECQLSLGNGTGRDVHHGAALVYGGRGIDVAFSVARDLTAAVGADAQLRCGGNKGGATIEGIRIQAIQVARLRKVDLATGEATETGVGIPFAIQGRLAAYTTLTPADPSWGEEYAVMAALPLPPGRWWAHATAIAQMPTPQRHAYFADCYLSVANGSDQSAVSMNRYVQPDPKVMELDVVSAFRSPRDASLECQGAEQTSVGDIRITALKVGRSTTSYEGDAPTTSGTGAPRVVHAADDQSSWNYDVDEATMASVTLPVGRWLVLGKLTASSEGIHVAPACRLAVADVTDHTEDLEVYYEQTFVMRLVAVVRAPGEAVIICQAATTPGFEYVSAWNVGISAIQVRDLNNPRRDTPAVRGAR